MKCPTSGCFNDGEVDDAVPTIVGESFTIVTDEENDYWYSGFYRKRRLDRV